MINCLVFVDWFQSYVFPAGDHLCCVLLGWRDSRGHSMLHQAFRILLWAYWYVILVFRLLCALMEARQRVPVGPTERDPIKRQFHSMTRTPQAPHHEVMKTCSNSQAVVLTGYESPQHRRYLRAVAESAEHQDDHSCWQETHKKSGIIQSSWSCDFLDWFFIYCYFLHKRFLNVRFLWMSQYLVGWLLNFFFLTFFFYNQAFNFKSI